jgi:hypothetical protein
VATKEINEELTSITIKLQSCNTDSDVSNNAENIEQHFHKIKGLAPMMNKIRVGKIAEMNDSLLKHILEGKIISGISDILKESTVFMKNDMENNSNGFENLKQKIQTRYSEFLE